MRARKAGKREEGFTVVELAATVIILGIVLLVIGVNYAHSRRVLALKAGVDEVEAAINRCYSIALQEGVDVYLEFWGEGGAHPDQYAIYRVYPDGTDERDTDTPTEPPAPGVKSQTDGSGHYWFQPAEGRVRVQSSIALLFTRQGTAVSVSNVTSPGSPMRVTLTLGDQARSVECNAMGEITSSG